MLALGDQPARNLVARLDGCSGGKAGEVIAAVGLERARCTTLDRAQARKLLLKIRDVTRPVSPDRLGFVGREAFAGLHYDKRQIAVALGGSEPQAQVPVVVEAWVQKLPPDKNGVGIRIFINRTPAVADIAAYRDVDHDICLEGAGLANYCQDVPKKGAFGILVNVTTPVCPITSDGKEPDLGPFADAIVDAVSAAVRKAHRAAPKQPKVSHKEVVLAHLEDEIAAVSGDHRYKFNQRQLLYRMRPIVLQETGRGLTEGNFNGIITDYENEHGEIALMYREPRGSTLHPHRNEIIPLGTLSVAEYERPAWLFHTLTYIEKEGFAEALKADGWQERHDAALFSSKGFSTRAARDFVDKLAAHDEPITVFCVHDADASGTMIYQTLMEATKARGARKIQIINLGLEPWEAIDLGLEIETVPQGDKNKPVASYVRERDEAYPNEAPGDISWEEWLQTHRVELNAFTTPEFLAWLDGKMEAHGVGKLIPPADVLRNELEDKLEGKVRDITIERILREADAEGQIRDALAEIERPDADELRQGIEELFEDEPEAEWRAHIETVADELSGVEPGDDDSEPEP